MAKEDELSDRTIDDQGELSGLPGSSAAAEDGKTTAGWEAFEEEG
jgi:hypothetical protein